MKINRNFSKHFVPIDITLESLEEAETLLTILEYTVREKTWSTKESKLLQDIHSILEGMVYVMKTGEKPKDA